MWSDVLPLEWHVGLHVLRYARYGNYKFHPLYTLPSSVNNSFHRKCGCRTHCSKHHWQNLTRWGKSSSLRPCTRCILCGYSRSSCSILQTVLLWTSPLQISYRCQFQGWLLRGQKFVASHTVLAVRGHPPSMVGMNLPLYHRRDMRENVLLHGSRLFGNDSWYRRLASCAFRLAQL